MYTPSALIFTAIVAFARIAVATPPACFLAALGVQTNPADMKALCSSLQPQMAGNITEKCSGDAQSSAVAVYSSSCLASESITITMPPTSTKGSTTSPTGTEATTTTDSGSAAKETDGESPSSPSSTNAASLSKPGLVLAPVALAVGLIGQYLV